MNFTIAALIILIIIGLLSGGLSGLIGIGGGVIIVPALVYFLAFSQKEAQGTSLGILLLPAGILGVIQYYKDGAIDLRVVFIVSIAFIIGNYFGSKIALSLPDKTLKKLFAIVLLVLGIKMFFFDSAKKPTPVTSPKTTVSDTIKT